MRKYDFTIYFRPDRRCGCWCSGDGACGDGEGEVIVKIDDSEKKDRYGRYPIWIKGKDANPQKIQEALYSRYGGQGYKFAIIFDCSKDEYEEPEVETPVYFLDDILDEVINYCGVEAVKKELERMENERN